MYPYKRLEVMQFLKELPVPGDDKVDLLVGWAKMVGVSVNASARRAVMLSGTDRTQFPSLLPGA